MFCRLLVALCLASAAAVQSLTVPDSKAQFSNPQRVTVRDYDGDAMEPFLTRDGRILFFNNLNEPTVNTNLHWAERFDDLTFQYRGEIAGQYSGARRRRFHGPGRELLLCFPAKL